MKLLIPMSLTSNFLMNTAFSGPFGYRSLSNNSKTTPYECSRVYTLQPLDSEALISTDDLLSPYPIHIRTTSAVSHNLCIILSYHINHIIM